MGRARRLKGQGTVTQHSSGMVRAQISMGTVSGKRQRLTSYHHDAKAAQDWIMRTLGTVARGDKLPSKLPLGEWLAGWLQRESYGRAPATNRDYARIVADMPAWLVSQPLGKLSPAHVQTWLDGMIGVSPRTVALRRNLLRAALNDAMRRELVNRNPAALARPPRQRRPRRTVVTAADCAAILKATAGWRYHAAVALSIGTGIRQGELLGLTWADVGLDRIIVRGRLLRDEGYVKEGTKASQDERIVPLPAFARDALAAWKTTQDAERAAAGDNVQPFDGSVPVFTTPRGRHVHGSYLTHEFQRLLAAAGLSAFRWHDLRDATAGLLSDAGVPQTVARDYLGHSTVATTQDHYTGSAWEALRRAGDALGAAVGQ